MGTFRATAALVGILVLVVACSSPTPASSAAPAATGAAPGATAAPKTGGTLVFGLPGDLQTAEPVFGQDANSDYIFRQVMESLIDLDPTGSKVLPRLATSWTASPDGLTYTFKLRTGVTFHDGTTFDAAAVKYNFDRWANMPRAAQALASRYPRIFDGFGAKSVITSVQTPDTSTVVMKLREPRSNFLTTLFMTSFTISSPKALQDGDANNPDLKQNRYANGSKPSMVGTGPFVFSEWVRGNHLTLTRNDKYWGQKAYLDRVTIRPFASESASFNALQAGDVDMILQMNPNDLSTLKGNKDLALIERGQPCNTFAINMNVKYPPLDNKEIRLAVAYALNRQSYIDAFYAGQAVLADNFTPSWMPYVTPLDIPKYDPAQARAHIQKSGIANPTLDFWYPTNVTRAYMPDPKGLFEAMSRDLEAVGFKVAPHSEGWTTGYLTDRTAGKLPMWLFGNFCPWPTIDGLLNFAWFGGDPQTGIRTETGYGTPELQRLIRDGLAAPTDAQAKDAWAKMQAIVKNDFPMVPILHALTPGAARTYVKGFVPSGLMAEDFDSVWLDK